MSVLLIVGLTAAVVGLIDALALALVRAAALTDRQSLRLARHVRRLRAPRRAEAAQRSAPALRVLHGRN